MYSGAVYFRIWVVLSRFFSIDWGEVRAIDDDILLYIVYRDLEIVFGSTRVRRY